MEPNTNEVNTEKLAREALGRVKAELAALKPEELALVNVDVQATTSTILGALPEIQLFRERIAKELPAVDLAAFDRLEDYALALSATQATFLVAAQPSDDLEPVTEEATRLRELLLTEARSHSLHGLIDSHTLDNLKGAKGRMNIAQDLQALSTLLSDNWPKIQGKTPTTQEDLLAASRVATRLTRLAGLREQGPVATEAATEQRQRAFTLVLRTYEEARAAIGYLRRVEQDAESIAPSLYSGRGKRKAADADAPTAPETPAAGTPPSPTTTAQFPAVTPAQAAAAVAQEGAPGVKHPFLS